MSLHEKSVFTGIFNDLRRQSFSDMCDFFNRNRIRGFLIVAFLIVLPWLPEFMSVPSFVEFENSLRLTWQHFSFLLFRLYVYAFCTLLLFRIFDEKEIRLTEQIKATIAPSIPLFQTLLFVGVVIGIVFEALHLAARAKLGMDPVGRVLDGHRILIVVNGLLAFMLLSDYAFFGSWLCGAFYVTGKPKLVLYRRFDLSLSNAKNYFLAWLYSWLMLILIPVGYVLIGWIWRLNAGLLMHFGILTAASFSSGWTRIIYYVSQWLACWLVLVPFYSQMQYFRLRVVQAVNENKENGENGAGS
jgi:hypothetical protein